LKAIGELPLNIINRLGIVCLHCQGFDKILVILISVGKGEPEGELFAGSVQE